MPRANWWNVSLALTMGACAASTPGGKPHDMGEANHEAEADAHSEKAAVHESQYDPNAATETRRCQSPHTPVSRAAVTDICWTSVTNPTDAHKKAADEHRRHAADHRAASAALRDAEAKACAGIAADDRDISPFDHPEDITAVEILKERTGNSKQASERAVGAIVTFRATPGLTAEWLQRIVECHLARNAALGHALPEMPNCPLVPKGVRARVASSGSGFAVSVRSDDPGVSTEIISRAERLRPAGAK